MQYQQNPPPYTPTVTTQTVIQTVPVVVPMETTVVTSYNVLVGSGPTLLVCPSCHAQVITRVEKSPSLRTHLIALCLCLFIFFPCVFLPYCTDSCNNSDHYCPNCSSYIGAYRF